MEDHVQICSPISDEFDLPDLETNNRGVLSAPVATLVAAAHARLDAIGELPEAERRTLAEKLRDCLIAASSQTWIPREDEDNPGRFVIVSSETDADGDPTFSIEPEETPGGRFRRWNVYHQGREIGHAHTVAEAKDHAAWYVAKLLD